MGREEKTNVARILDRNKIAYELVNYDCEQFIDGVHSAELSGRPVELTYKTLVLRGRSGGHHVCVIPAAAEVDLKAAARACAEKSVELLPLRELTAVTGYVRGGCSPLGMKKSFPTVIDASAEAHASIYVSAGRIGTSVCLAPGDLAAVTRATYADIIVHAVE